MSDIKKPWYKSWKVWVGVFVAFAIIGSFAPPEEEIEVDVAPNVEPNVVPTVAPVVEEDTAAEKAEQVDKVAADAKAKADAEAKKKSDEAAAAKKKADEKAKAKAKEEAEKVAQQALIDTALANFAIAKEALVNDSGGVITSATIEYDNFFTIDVYVDEAVWASSSESEKESFATTIGTAIQSSLPDDAYVDFRSATNKDVIAKAKLLGGYDIKR